MQKAVFIVCVSLSFGLIGCDAGNAAHNRGPIVFGDSSMIVTERDPQFLNDDISDFVPKSEEARKDSPATTPQPVTEAAATPVPDPAVKEEPVAVSAKGINIFVSGLSGGSKRIDWNKERHAGLMIAPEPLSGKSLQVQGLTDVTVKQREQTVVTIRLRNGSDVRLSLPGSYSSWEQLKGRNGNFPISGVKDGQLRYEQKLNQNSLRNAVQKVARSHRMSKRETDDLLKSLRNVRSAGQKPLDIALQSVVWRIQGKDAGGKNIDREFRIDFSL
ncbi:MAG: hypothetical protein QM743_11490 [Chitinophagaceae bacterium]